MVLLSVGKVTESHLYTATQVTDDGYLIPSKSYSVRKNLSDFILSRRSMKEPGLVKLMWVFCGISCAAAIVLAVLSTLYTFGGASARKKSAGLPRCCRCSEY